MSIYQNLYRWQALFAEWIARRFPWYVRLVAGKHADEVFQRIAENAKRFHEN
jgi:hypothetical protein